MPSSQSIANHYFAFKKDSSLCPRPGLVYGKTERTTETTLRRTVRDNHTHPGTETEAEAKKRYNWPWLVLAALLLGLALAVLWMSKEIERTRRIRDANSPNAPLGR
jgi:hypothetical protein